MPFSISFSLEFLLDCVRSHASSFHFSESLHIFHIINSFWFFCMYFCIISFFYSASQILSPFVFNLMHNSPVIIYLFSFKKHFIWFSYKYLSCFVIASLFSVSSFKVADFSLCWFIDYLIIFHPKFSRGNPNNYCFLLLLVVGCLLTELVNFYSDLASGALFVGIPRYLGWRKVLPSSHIVCDFLVLRILDHAGSINSNSVSVLECAWDYKFSFCRWICGCTLPASVLSPWQVSLSSCTSVLFFYRPFYHSWGRLSISDFVPGKRTCGWVGRRVCVCVSTPFSSLSCLFFSIQLLSKFKPPFLNFFCSTKIFTLFCQPFAGNRNLPHILFVCVVLHALTIWLPFSLYLCR